MSNENLHSDIVHQLRSCGWQREDAVKEADRIMTGSRGSNSRPLDAQAMDIIEDIACLDDEEANEHLRATGSYVMFEERHSVEKARRLLSHLTENPAYSRDEADEFLVAELRAAGQELRGWMPPSGQDPAIDEAMQSWDRLVAVPNAASDDHPRS